MTSFCPESFRPAPEDWCGWAKWVNSRWIVHGGLKTHAEEYMRHLSVLDPGRLERACRNARSLMEQRERWEDPKAWFYAGLFSCATEEEVARFLDGHPFTRAAVLRDGEETDSDASRSGGKKLQRIRAALGRL